VIAATALLVAAVATAVLVEVVIWRRQQRPRTPRGHLRAGDRAFAKGDLDAAAEHYREAIRLDHVNPQAHYDLALVAWEREDYEGVIHHLRQCQRWAPDTAEVEHGLGAAYQQKGDHEAAMRHYCRAIELDPEAQDTRESLAALYHELGRETEAKEVCPEFEPEAAARADRLWRQLGEAGRKRVRMWVTAVQALDFSTAVSRAIVVTCIVLLVANLVYGVITLPREPALFTRYGDIFGAIFRVSFVAAILSRLGAGALSALAPAVLRKELRRSGASQQDISAFLPQPRDRPWWKVELSGGHLVLWLGLPLLVVSWRQSDALPEWCLWIGMYLTLLWFFKGVFMFSLLTQQGERREKWQKEYRYFSTLKGALVGLIGLPVALAAVGFGLWQIMGLIGL
jgi:tetratricopeptide (TPR) repeat protein